MTYRPVSQRSGYDGWLCWTKGASSIHVFISYSFLSSISSVILHCIGSLVKQNMRTYKKKTTQKDQTWRPYPMKLLAESLFTGHGYESHRTQKRATTLISRPPAPPEPAPEPWAWFDPWPTWIWWRPELKLAHSRLVESLGERETSGPAPSRDNVAKQTEQKMAEGELEESCGTKD